jgi:hypothetical protein
MDKHSVSKMNTWNVRKVEPLEMKTALRHPIEVNADDERTANPTDGTIYTGGRITLAQSAEGGTWDFGKACLSRDSCRFGSKKE